jgi:hypothetical protein
MMPMRLQTVLNLSSNLFEGPIPSDLSQLMGLKVLDLSNNKFSGEIPVRFTQMATLTELILSNNQLSGVIPVFPPRVSIKVTGNAGIVDTSEKLARKKGRQIRVTIIVGAGAFFLIFFLFFFLLLLGKQKRN